MSFLHGTDLRNERSKQSDQLRQKEIKNKRGTNLVFSVFLRNYGADR